jgi:hypothetical protein
MKRQFDVVDNDRMLGNKRYRTDGFNDALAEGKFELRLLIPTKSAGAVIGKGGETIKTLRTKVRVVPLSSPFLLLSCAHVGMGQGLGIDLV